MAEVISFEGYRPPPRYDSIPWTEARLYEAATSTGVGTLLETFTLSPVDADPSDPAYRDFTTELGTAPELWYWIVFADASGDTAAATDPVQNISVTYASLDELFRILKIRNPSDEQRAAGARVLTAAAGEINSEIDLASTVDLEGWQLLLVAQVNLDRAADLWRHTESIPGLTGMLGDDGGQVLPGRYSWERYAQRLAPIKSQWGLA
jgi:hypothetical protein